MREPCVIITAVVMTVSCLLSVGQSLQCLDANKNDVDWYAVYKNPKLYKPNGLRFREGLSYFYLDVHTPQWTLEENAINDTDTAVYNTLAQIYSSKNGSIFYLMYNDEHPSVETWSGERGHTKGVVAFDDTRGFWLVHSCPMFPPSKSKGYHWKSQDYGQNLLCITFPYKQLGSIGTQLLYNEPDVYDWDLRAQVLSDFPVLSLVIHRKHPAGPPWFSVAELTSAGGQGFTSFAKAGKYGADLYDSLVAPTLKTDLLVETWLRTSGTELDSNCTAKYHVLRVNSIGLPNGVSFHETKDHSKWAAAYHSNSTTTTHQSVSQLWWVCVGDINRMKSQFKRGGGTVCLQHASVWKAYAASAGDMGLCPHHH